MVGDRKGIQLQKLCTNSPLFNMNKKEMVWPIVPHVQPHVYIKQNGGEPGQAGGQSCGHYKGHTPDALQGSRWGEGRILLMFQTAKGLQPGTLELCQASLVMQKEHCTGERSMCTVYKILDRQDLVLQ